jgi:ferredoxin
MAKVIQDHEKCIGCGNCVNVCPDNWEMGSDGKAHPKEKEVKEIGCNKAAAEGCPVECITIEE